MTRRPLIFVLAAFTLLIAAGTDLLIVDFISPTLCDDSQSSDECFCCCAHIVMPLPPVVMPVQMLDYLEPTPPPHLFTSEPGHVYRPPRA